MDDLQPQVQGQVAAFKDGADPHGKLLPARIALVQPRTGRSAFQPLDAGALVAVRADRAIGPQRRLYERKGSGFVLKMLGAQNRAWPWEISYARTLYMGV